MKKYIAVTVLTLAANMAFAGTAINSRQDDVLKEGLKLANDQRSEIGSLVQKEREEGANGYQPDADMVVRKPLTAKDVKIVRISQENYSGKIEPDANKSDPGYDNRTYLLIIPKRTVSYGGRITSTDSILVACTSEAVSSAKKSTIECKAQSLVNGK